MNSLDDILAEWADVTTQLDELATRRERLADQLRTLGEGSCLLYTSPSPRDS